MTQLVVLLDLPLSTEKDGYCAEQSASAAFMAFNDKGLLEKTNIMKGSGSNPPSDSARALAPVARYPRQHPKPARASNSPAARIRAEQ